MARSVWKGPFVDSYVLKKAEASREGGRNEVIKIWSRRSPILPQFVGLTFGVYNGHKHIPVNVSEDMIGQKFGEYSPTRTYYGHAAALIRGKSVDKALTDLTFSKKRVAQDVKKCLQSAIANAENNHNLDVDELIVAEAYVGKNLTMKRGRPRARGRFGKIIKPFAEITIKVRQVEEQA